jgi:hypothetical protein
MIIHERRACAVTGLFLAALVSLGAAFVAGPA